MNPVYEPAEDSELIGRRIPEYAEKAQRVLDMGTGSGVLASIAANYCEDVVAVDVNPRALQYAKEHHPKPNITFLESNLFQNVEGKFDLITFNAPYLPTEEGVTDLALDGGKEGWEVIEKFLKKAKEHLTKKGKILLLFSSHTNKEKVEELMDTYDYTYTCIEQEKLFFEELYVYELH